MKVVGVDGCKSGWFAIVMEDERWYTAIYKNIHNLVDDNGNAESILIDIPIGLRNSEKNGRLCDLESRKVLRHGRASSVFPTPCRSALYCSSYEAASSENIRCVGKALTIQTWGIIPKILEVDTFLGENPELIHVIRESHPEVAFWGLNNKNPMKFKKKSEDGLRERLEVLENHDARAAEIYRTAIDQYLRKDVAKDDILDALCMAITGQMVKNGIRCSLPQQPEIDDHGLPMQIIYFDENVQNIDNR